MSDAAGEKRNSGVAAGDDRASIGTGGLDPAADPPAAARQAWSRRSVAILLAGGLLTGGLAGAVVSAASVPQAFEIDQLPQAELVAATPSMVPAEAAASLEEAKACRTPLAYLTLRAHPGSTGTVRIRSGDYWTATIHVGAGPVRVALPFPTPYPTARGDLLFESDGATFDVFLRPGWATEALQGTAIAHIWWTPKAPC